MRNIALFLTYEGTAYHGWQSQKNLATVLFGGVLAAVIVLGRFGL